VPSTALVYFFRHSAYYMYGLVPEKNYTLYMNLFTWPSIVEFMTFYEIIKSSFTTIDIQINSDEFVSHRIHFVFRFLSLKCEDRV